MSTLFCLQECPRVRYLRFSPYFSTVDDALDSASGSWSRGLAPSLLLTLCPSPALPPALSLQESRMTTRTTQCLSNVFVGPRVFLVGMRALKQLHYSSQAKQWLSQHSTSSACDESTQQPACLSSVAYLSSAVMHSFCELGLLAGGGSVVRARRCVDADDAKGRRRRGLRFDDRQFQQILQVAASALEVYRRIKEDIALGQCS